ncbi:site-specific DNA-methyltransferase, partial [Endozoicomonas atrinae]|uniref:site-specific DNA-methyltransferase n=1 Tax=Endozoicomonas atrinae TaxID=1333660 RepID=UPI000B30DC2F
ISKLKQLFPELITEDASGAKIDVDVLNELVGHQVIDGDKERYNFTWHGKAAARRLAQTPSTGTLRPCKKESKDWDTTQNLFIEGDNLEVLKLLQKSYHKKVKMIYIDPPYNTGKDFIYKDNFKDNIANYKKITGQIDDEGNPLKTNPETSGRYHTHWLNMMYPRLRLARNLLKDDGVIFISIDDTELKNLIEICDNVFGSENFIANFIWEKRTNRENRKIVSGRHDYVVCYTKNRDPLIRPINQLPMSEKALANYKNPDNDPLGEWKSDPASAQAGHGTKSQFYVLTAPNGKQHHLQSGRCWVYTQPEMERAIREGRIWFGKDGNGVPRIKTYLHSKERGLTPESIIFAEDASTNEGAKNALKDLFGGISVFETPKPVDLIRLAIQLSCDDGYVLDFFSGSASTAHAVLKQNALDGKKRKFILVQLPEECDELSEAYKAGYKTISEIGIDRIKKAGDKVLKENHDKVDIKNIDTGFKVFKLDSSNIKPWDADFENLEQMILGADDSLKEGRSADDVLYEILLKYGLDLTLPIEEHILAGKTVHNIGNGALMICLDDEITLDVVNAIGDLKKELQPEVMRVVFKDAGFADPVVKTNAIQVLKQFGIDDVKSI